MKLYLSFSFLILFSVSLFSCESTSEREVREVMDVVPEEAFAILQLNGNKLASHAENSEQIPRALFKPLLKKSALHEFEGVNYEGQSVAFAEFSEDNTFVALVYALSSPSELKRGLLAAYPELRIKEEKGYSAAALNENLAAAWNENFLMVGLSPMIPFVNMFPEDAEDLQEVFGKYLSGKGGPGVGQNGELLQTYFTGNADANFVFRPGKLDSGIAKLIAESQGVSEEDFEKSVFAAGIHFQQGKVQIDAKASLNDPIAEALLAGLGGHLSKDMLALCPVADPKMLVGLSFDNQSLVKVMESNKTSSSGLFNELLRGSGLSEKEFVALFSGQVLVYHNGANEQAPAMFFELEKPQEFKEVLAQMCANDPQVSEVEPGKLFLVDDEYGEQNWLALRDNYLLWAAGPSDAQAFLNGPLRPNVLDEKYINLSQKGTVFAYLKGDADEAVDHIEFYNGSASTARIDVFLKDRSQNALQVLLSDRKGRVQ